jgi:2,4-diketo-3-deoxy-L-fuconate hydrolase
MKLFRHGLRGGERPGVVDGRGIHRDLTGVIADIDDELLSTNFAPLRGCTFDSLPTVDKEARFGPPIAFTGKFICIGLNYADHVRESGAETPSEPVVFLKATSAICGPTDDLVLPRGSQKTDWEVELGLIIGRPGRYVDRDDGLSHVAGLCVVNDVSERAFQLERGSQWDKGKGCDSFGPIGPYLVTLDEIADINRLRLWCDVNGRRMQDGNTAEMIFDPAFLVHYVSQFMSLQPGDIISTGTPPGVGLGRQPPTWLQEGDIVTLGIDGLGAQRQRVTREAGAFG